MGLLVSLLCSERFFDTVALVFLCHQKQAFWSLLINLIILVLIRDLPAKENTWAWLNSLRLKLCVIIIIAIFIECMERFKSFFLEFQKKARIAFSDQEGRNELLGGEDSQSSEDQVILMSK